MRRLSILCLTLAVAAAGAVAVTASGAGGARVKLRKTELGRVVVDGQGRTLYLYARDAKNRSTCTGVCADLWPPATTSGRPVAGKGVHAKQLKAIRRADGTRQVTYYGHPLYRYKLDNGKPGNVYGQTLGDRWYVVRADGRPVRAHLR